MIDGSDLGWRRPLQSLMRVGEDLHADTGLSMGHRAVLEYLDRYGDTTVPGIARARRVSRQRIQTLVNPLLDAGLVASKENPASRRSPLIALTRAGKRQIDAMRRAERRILQVELPADDVIKARETLQRLREAIEEAQWGGPVP